MNEDEVRWIPELTWMKTKELDPRFAVEHWPGASKVFDETLMPPVSLYHTAEDSDDPGGPTNCQGYDPHIVVVWPAGLTPNESFEHQ